MCKASSAARFTLHFDMHHNGTSYSKNACQMCTLQTQIGHSNEEQGKENTRIKQGPFCLPRRWSSCRCARACRRGYSAELRCDECIGRRNRDKLTVHFFNQEGTPAASLNIQQIKQHHLRILALPSRPRTILLTGHGPYTAGVGSGEFRSISTRPVTVSPALYDDKDQYVWKCDQTI